MYSFFTRNSNKLYAGRTLQIFILWEKRMKKKRFNLSALSGLTFILLMISLETSGCGKAVAEADSDFIRPVKAMALVSSPPERIITFPGKAKASQEVNLAFRVEGPLTELNADDGMKVLKGDILARIDSRDFRVNLKTLEAKLAASKAHCDEAGLQFERHKNLVKENATSKSTYDQVKAGFEMAKAQVEADTRNVEAARNALSDTTLSAPFDGYVHKILVENYETVKKGQAVIWMVDLSGLEVEIGISESLLSRTPDFTSFTCSFDSQPGIIFHAKLKEFGKKPNPSNSTYPLILTLDEQATDLIRPGMAADVNVSMVSAEAMETFVIPASALVNKTKDETYVWILNREKGQIEKRSVMQIQLSTGGVEVKGNVNKGEWLVTAGAHQLTEGQAARLLEPASTTNIGGVL